MFLKYLKTLVLCILLSIRIACFADNCQKKSPFSASLELSTKYMWRGIEYGTAPRSEERR